MLDLFQRGALGLMAAAGLVMMISLIAAIFVDPGFIFVTMCAALTALLMGALYCVFAAVEILFD